MEQGKFAYRANLEAARKALLDRTGSTYAGPTAKQQLEQQKEGLMRPKSRPAPEMSGGLAEGVGLALMEAMQPAVEETAVKEEEEGLKSSLRPEPRYATEFKGTYKPSGDLASDSEFTASIEKLAKKRGISTSELYKVIQGESSFNPTARNKSGATGLFQIMPDSAKELGVSTGQILKMTPAQQVDLYDKYLGRWDYSSKNRLGIMQAAPAFANREPEAVIYSKGSKAWDQNPGWRELNDGPITVRSINSYYARQGK